MTLPTDQNAALFSALTQLLLRAEQVLGRVESAFLPAMTEPDWDAQATAFRWQRRQGHARLVPVHHPHPIRLSDVHDVDAQKEKIVRNTRQFLSGRPANNVLLTGARGTGKSSLVKAVLTEYAAQGLRLIEVDKSDLTDLPEIIGCVENRPERFILFCDDLSFEAEEPGYKALKSVLDGSVSTLSANVLIYATSNRRHLLPEYMSDNLERKRVNDEIHPGETVEEKISLSERFGLWISFYPFSQESYLTIVAHWLGFHGLNSEQIAAARTAALQWAIERGGRSGRIAAQFARDYAGQLGLADEPPMA